MRRVLLAIVSAILVATSALVAVDARADDTTTTEADAQRLLEITRDAASSTRSLRLAAGWSVFGFGVAEVGAGGVLLGTLADDNLRMALPVGFFVAGASTIGMSFTTLLIKSEIEKLAARTASDMADSSIPLAERVARAVRGLRIVADNEERGRVTTIVGMSILLGISVAGEAIVLSLNGLTSDERVGFGTALAVRGALEVATIVLAVLTHPAGSALDTWERGRRKSALRVEPVIGPTGLGIVGVF